MPAALHELFICLVSGRDLIWRAAHYARRL
jgi:hypothetical protein